MFLPGANHLCISYFHGISHEVADFTRNEKEVLPREIVSFPSFNYFGGAINNY